MVVYGFIAKLVMPADSEFPALETTCADMCIFISPRNDNKIISHIKMNKNVLF